LTTVFNDAPFLQFSNQLSSFTAGEPDLTFRRDKKDYFAVWGADVDLDLIAEEMQQWMRSVQKVLLFYGVVSHTYIYAYIHSSFTLQVQEYTYSGPMISRAVPNLWQPLGKITLQVYLAHY
jgi:hypothetical protein